MSKPRRGLCRCGCGRATSLARSTNRKEGLVKGQPVAYVWGHSGGARSLKEGQRFGRWTVVGKGVRKWYSRGVIRIAYPVRCECGTEALVQRQDLVSGESSDCGDHVDPPLSDAARTYLREFERWLLDPNPSNFARRRAALHDLLPDPRR